MFILSQPCSQSEISMDWFWWENLKKPETRVIFHDFPSKYGAFLKKIPYSYGPLPVISTYKPHL